MMSRFVFKILLLCVSAFYCGLLTSCVSYYSKRGLYHPINIIQSAVERNLPEGVGWISKNHREMHSKYFHPGNYDKKYKSSKRRAFRAKAHVFILGDMRPYHLMVRVYLETRVSGGPERLYSQSDLAAGRWIYIGKEGNIAKRLGKKIHDYIIKTDRDWDLIDNFRPY